MVNIGGQSQATADLKPYLSDDRCCEVNIFDLRTMMLLFGKSIPEVGIYFYSKNICSLSSFHQYTLVRSEKETPILKLIFAVKILRWCIPLNGEPHDFMVDFAPISPPIQGLKRGSR